MVHRIGEVTPSLQLDPVFCIFRQIDAQFDRVVYVDIYLDIQPVDLHRADRIELFELGGIVERDECNDILVLLFHLQRGVLHDVVHLRAAQQRDVSPDEQIVEPAFDFCIQIHISLSVHHRLAAFSHVDHLEIGCGEEQVCRDGAKVPQVYLSVDRQRLLVRCDNLEVAEPDETVVDRDRAGRQCERSPDHPHFHGCFRKGKAAVDR